MCPKQTLCGKDYKRMFACAYSKLMLYQRPLTQGKVSLYSCWPPVNFVWIQLLCFFEWTIVLLVLSNPDQSKPGGQPYSVTSPYRECSLVTLICLRLTPLPALKLMQSHLLSFPTRKSNYRIMIIEKLSNSLVDVVVTLKYWKNNMTRRITYLPTLK